MTPLFKHKHTTITPQFLYKSAEVSDSHIACKVSACGREALLAIAIIPTTGNTDYTPFIGLAFSYWDTTAAE